VVPVKIKRSEEAPIPSMGYAGTGVSLPEDYPWLTDQMRCIYEVMRDGQWRKPSEITAITGIRETSVQAQLRNMRLERFGAYDVPMRRAEDPRGGRHEWRVGPKGSGNPERHACPRALDAERLGAELADALEEFDPDSPLLAAWDALFG
jgi:hypothetical protein